jgi:predicted DNA-binding transcriptional regulator YafY
MVTKKMYSQAARVQGILRTLGARQGITIGELAEEFGVTKRTLYRDLKALEEAGYPLLSEVVDGITYWKVEPSLKGVAPVTFTLNELMALYSSRKLMVSPGSSPFHADLESAFTFAQPTKGFRTVNPGKRLKSLSIVHNSLTPCCRHKAATRASCTCGPATRPV